MAGRKVFTAGEVLQAADVNDYLMDQSVMVFAGTAARGSAIPSPTEGMVTYLSDSDEVQVYDGSVFKAIGPGKILQVVSAIRSEPSSASITTAGDFIGLTGLSATITPSATSSKVLVLVSVSFAPRSVTQNSRTFYRLMRDSTPIGNGDTASSRTSAFTGLYLNSDADVVQGTANYLDSPNTTSAVTYSVQGTSSASSDSIVINRSSADADLLGRARTASYITLLEVAG